MKRDEVAQLFRDRDRIAGELARADAALRLAAAAYSKAAGYRVTLRVETLRQEVEA